MRFRLAFRTSAAFSHEACRSLISSDGAASTLVQNAERRERRSAAEGRIVPADVEADLVGDRLEECVVE